MEDELFGVPQLHGVIGYTLLIDIFIAHSLLDIFAISSWCILPMSFPTYGSSLSNVLMAFSHSSHEIYNTQVFIQALWHMPIVSAIPELEIRGLPDPRTSRPKWDSETFKNIRGFSCLCYLLST